MRQFKLIILIIAGLLLIQPCIMSAPQNPEGDGEYFTYKKYAYTYMYFSKIERVDYKRDGLAERKIKALADKLVWGFDALSQERTDDAIVQFRGGLKVLPEYFHLDFMLALSYEEKGDHIKAARSYSSYLEKLKKFHMGMFPITKSMIQGTVDFDILSYPEAEELIKQRMAGYGIDLEEAGRKRYPILPIAIFLVVVGFVAAFIAAKGDSIKRSIYKTKAKLYRDGEYWICTNCGKENANINTKCHNCSEENRR